MAKSEMKHLRRSELLELLIAQTKKSERLQTQLDEANAELTKREIDITNSGSIAEASIKINRVYDVAQDAADQYVENVKRHCDVTVANLKAAAAKTVEILSKAALELEKEGKDAEEIKKIIAELSDKYDV